MLAHLHARFTLLYDLRQDLEEFRPVSDVAARLTRVIDFSMTSWLRIKKDMPQDTPIIENEIANLIEPRHEKTGFLHMRKQRRRSASR